MKKHRLTFGRTCYEFDSLHAMNTADKLFSESSKNFLKVDGNFEKAMTEKFIKYKTVL
jgi:hypothetical protein